MPSFFTSKTLVFFFFKLSIWLTCLLMENWRVEYEFVGSYLYFSVEAGWFVAGWLGRDAHWVVVALRSVEAC